MKSLLRIILMVGLIMLFYNCYDLVILSYAEEPVTNKKTYEELQNELQRYKNIYAIEAGFRTVDIIFGGNNVFANLGHFCDSIINVLDAYYLGTPIKGTFIIGVAMGLTLAIVLYVQGDIVEVSSLSTFSQGNVDSTIMVLDEKKFISEIMEKAGYSLKSDSYTTITKYGIEKFGTHKVQVGTKLN